MTKKLLAFGALAVAATPSFATDLWNQQVGLTSGFNGFEDQQFTDSADSSTSTYTVADVLVGSAGWNITSISMEVIDNGNTSAVTQALLNIFPNTGQNSLPAVQNDPTAGTLENVTFTSLGNIGGAGGAAYLMTVSGLSLHLNAGEYWVGLTGIGDRAANELKTGVTTVNSAGAAEGSAWINPQGGFGLGTNWQTIGSVFGDTADYTAIDIQGTAAPEPVSMTLLGLGVVGLISRRRRK